MQTNWNENQALLQGTVAEEPVFSHENHGIQYDSFPLTVRRLSGAEDRVNVIAARSSAPESRRTVRGKESYCIPWFSWEKTGSSATVPCKRCV